MNDLLCVVPLYGANCEKISLRMITSLSIQETRYDVTYMFLYDKTVSLRSLLNIEYLMNNNKYVIMFSESTHSGFKRNKGIKYADEHSFKYIWFLDQDDYLLRTDTFDLILDYLIPNNNQCLSVGYSIPTSVNEYNAKHIKNTITMPWLYIIRVNDIKDYRFDEESEYGSDVPYTIRFLAENKYVEINENQSMIIKKLPMIRVDLYFYNYLNDNSYMYKHLTMNDAPKEKQIEEARQRIENIRLSVLERDKNGVQKS